MVSFMDDFLPPLLSLVFLIFSSEPLDCLDLVWMSRSSCVFGLVPFPSKWCLNFFDAYRFETFCFVIFPTFVRFQCTHLPYPGNVFYALVRNGFRTYSSFAAPGWLYLSPYSEWRVGAALPLFYPDLFRLPLPLSTMPDLPSPSHLCFVHFFPSLIWRIGFVVSYAIVRCESLPARLEFLPVLNSTSYVYTVYRSKLNHFLCLSAP